MYILSCDLWWLGSVFNCTFGGYVVGEMSWNKVHFMGHYIDNKIFYPFL